MLLFVIAVSSSVCYLIWLSIQPYFFCTLRDFPSAKNGRWMSYLLAIFMSSPGQYLLETSEAVPNQGLVLLRAPLHKNRLLATTPDVLTELLDTRPYDFRKPLQIAMSLRHVLGRGLVLAEGDDHRIQRKRLRPAFALGQIKKLYPKILQQALEFSDVITSEINEQKLHGKAEDGGSLDITSWATRVALDIIGIAGFGIEFKALQNAQHPVVHVYSRLFEPTVQKGLHFMLSVFFSRRVVKLIPWSWNDESKICTDDLLNICDEYVCTRRFQFASDRGQSDILSTLIRSDQFSDTELTEQMLTILAAGHETIASTFSWACYLLAIHPEYQEQLRSELDGAGFGSLLVDEPSKICMVLQSLPFLNAVCQETFRMYPSVPTTMRAAINDTTLLGHHIPKETEILIVPWMMNRCKSIWGSDATKFVPERWLDRKKSQCRAEEKRRVFTFLHGSRACIGRDLAQAELCCLLAVFVQSFTWTLDIERVKWRQVIPAGIVTAKPVNGVHLKIDVMQAGKLG